MHLRAPPPPKSSIRQIFGRPVVETYAGILKWNTDVCWYLDSAFCSRFHRLKLTMGSPSNARGLFEGITLGIMAVAILFYACVFCRAFFRVTGMDQYDDEGNGTRPEKGWGNRPMGRARCPQRVGSEWARSPVGPLSRGPALPWAYRERPMLHRRASANPPSSRFSLVSAISLSRATPPSALPRSDR